LILPEKKGKSGVLHCSALTPLPDLKFKPNYPVKFPAPGRSGCQGEHPWQVEPRQPTVTFLFLRLSVIQDR